ncbi:uncharacterized protein A4U43_C08F25650 [Asparagus officinalis]|nr:uncharacterized protein A4U43_C08F25650 [Asparagus officinalis]
MEAYLQGQDLWDLVTGDDTLPDDTLQLADARRKWKIKCGKALFALRTSINKEYIDHVREMESLKEIWDTLERLFTQKNTMRLQYLENELASLTQDKSRTRNAHKFLSSSGKQQKAEGEQSSTSKLTCYWCGKVGHIKANCRVKIVCKRCEKSGHIKPNCRVKLVESDVNIAHEVKEEDEPN